MKRFAQKMTLALLAVLMLSAFAGCTSTDNGAASETDTQTATETTGSDGQDTAEITDNESAGKTYLIYSDNAFAPFEYYDEATSTYVGIDMDLLAAIAEDQGFTYEIRNEGFDASMGAVQSGQADAMIAGMTITETRQETFDFSDGYYSDGQILVVGTDSTISSLEDLRGTVVAAKTSTQGATYAEENKDTYGYEIQYYEDSPTMYTAVMNGTNSACFEDQSVVLFAIQNESLALKTVGDVINPGSYGFAVKKGTNSELIELFNAGLANIKANGTYDEILAKYGN